MNAQMKLLKKEIFEKIDELPSKNIKELHDFVIFLEVKNILPKIDPSQAYFWTSKWQKSEKNAENDIKSNKISGPFKTAATLLKHLKK